jgi:hypothetical protein
LTGFIKNGAFNIIRVSETSRSKMLSIIQVKACKRCGGDLSIESDIYGIFIECIQCGATYSKKDLQLMNSQKNSPNTKAETPKPLATTSHKV